jgi:LacI family transcriptional regulator
MKIPASIVCANDYIAFGVYEAAKELGLKVGRDLAVTGFDNLTFSSRIDPPLTTVHVDPERIGYLAAKLIHQHIQKQFSEPQQVIVPSEIKERSSC